MLLLFYLVSIVFIVVLLLTFIKFLIRDSSLFTYSREEASSYECGFEQHSLSRVPLSVRYFLLTLVFLLFDLEIILLLLTPLDIIFCLSKELFSLVSLLFIFVLFLGLLYEWYDGALEWVL